jgi:predicted nuclease with TOPRIM domain
MDEQDLLDLKNKIEQAKQEVSKLEGRQEHLLQTLAEDWDCGDYGAAEDKLKDMEDEISDINDTIETKTNELKKDYDVS